MKKIIALLLSCAILVGCFSTSVFADTFPENSVESYSVEEASQLPYAQLLAGTDDKAIVEEHPYEPSAEEVQLAGEKKATVVTYNDGTEATIYRIPVYE